MHFLLKLSLLIALACLVSSLKCLVCDREISGFACDKNVPIVEKTCNGSCVKKQIDTYTRTPSNGYPGFYGPATLEFRYCSEEKSIISCCDTTFLQESYTTSRGEGCIY